MPCILAIIALSAPRLVLALVFVFSDYLEKAIHSSLWLLLGFLFMPFTTLAYSWAINSRGSVGGFHFVVVLIAVLMDLGVIGGARKRKKKDD